MASIIKADNIQKVSDGTNIIKKCGSTITLGSTGATIALACGASQTGFGQTYSAVEYCTTVKTAPFTAVAGKGYFINTTCAAVTVTLPATPTAGDVISVSDYGKTAATNNITIARNGNNIDGCTICGNLNNNNQSVSLIYVDGTKGWVTVNNSTAGSVGQKLYVTATGGTVYTCGDYKIHQFLSDGCFSVSCAGNPAGSSSVDYLVVAGGGSGGPGCGGGTGGGGAGGLRIGAVTPSGCHSPLVTSGLPVSATTYPITIGGGGSAASGNNSIFSTITSAGGGRNGTAGGSGGGGTGPGGGGTTPGGTGNTPPVSPPQGNDGGAGTAYGPSNTGLFAGGGGGGATAAGTTNPAPSGPAGPGGTGLDVTPVFGAAPKSWYLSNTPNAAPVSTGYFAGGGGGASGRYAPAPPGYPSGSGGTGGGGQGGTLAQSGGNATTNSGGGGGGGGFNGSVGTQGSPGSGGSGIVLIRYKFQN